MERKNYIGMGYQFHHLVRESILEMIEEGNKTNIISSFDENQSEEDSWKEYESKTRWNDFNIGVPLLFNFYHGLELLMKGILQEIGITIKPTHNLNKLFEQLTKNDNLPIELLSSLEKYISISNPFQRIFEDNKLTPNEYYSLFRYPVNRGNTHFYKEVRGKEENGLKNFITLKEDIKKIKNEIVRWKTT